MAVHRPGSREGHADMGRLVVSCVLRTVCPISARSLPLLCFQLVPCCGRGMRNQCSVRSPVSNGWCCCLPSTISKYIMAGALIRLIGREGSRLLSLQPSARAMCAVMLSRLLVGA